MIKTGNTTVNIYTESTPNPETMKFVANKLILHGGCVDFPDVDSAQVSPLAAELFMFPFVKGVFIASNFVTLSKTENTDWVDIIPTVKDFLKKFLDEDREPVSKDFSEKLNARNLESGVDDSDVVARIKALLDDYVKPAVEMDGGAIQFKKYDKGIVTVSLQGSCAGCPSSMITLKSGIENMMKKMIPEVKEVVTSND